MRKDQMNVRLVPSDKMDNSGAKENNYIRIPRRARLHFDTQNQRLALQVGKKTKILQIKPTYKEDIKALHEGLKASEITEEQAKITGYVTTVTFREMLGRRRNNVENYSYVTDGVEDIKLGADPEFVLVNPKSGRFQYAQHVKGLHKTAELGHDGPLAEVRPPPETSVSGVVSNIAKILKRDQSSIEEYNWYGGAAFKNSDFPGDRVPAIGGHIHFGNPILLPEDQKNSIYERIVRVLDETIAVPLVRIDCPLPHLRRNTAHNGYGHYGRSGDMKPQAGRFEWRVLSGLWLAHPELAQSVLGASKAVVEASLQMMAESGFEDSYISARADRKGFLKAWGSMDPKKVTKIINDADPAAVPAALLNRSARKLRGMGNYQKYKAEIEEFIRLAKLSKRDRSKINLNLKDTWLNKGRLILGG